MSQKRLPAARCACTSVQDSVWFAVGPNGVARLFAHIRHRCSPAGPTPPLQSLEYRGQAAAFAFFHSALHQTEYMADAVHSLYLCTFSTVPPDSTAATAAPFASIVALVSTFLAPLSQSQAHVSTGPWLAARAYAAHASRDAFDGGAPNAAWRRVVRGGSTCYRSTRQLHHSTAPPSSRRMRRDSGAESTVPHLSPDRQIPSSAVSRVAFPRSMFSLDIQTQLQLIEHPRADFEPIL